MHSEQDSEEEGRATRDSCERPTDTRGGGEACTPARANGSGHHTSTAAANTSLGAQHFGEKGVFTAGSRDIQESHEEGVPASLRYLTRLP